MASGVILARAGEQLPIPKVSGSTALEFERALLASEHTAYVFRTGLLPVEFCRIRFARLLHGETT